MSELIAEARVLVRPDTTRFRQDLRQQLEVAGRGVVVPVQVAPIVSGAGAAAAAAAAQSTAQLGAAAGAAATSVEGLGLAEFKASEGAVLLATSEERASAAALEGAASAKVRAAALKEEERAAVAAAAAQRQGIRGAVSAALSFAGLRGATLAAGGAFLAGAAAVAALGKSLSAFAQFQTSLNTFRVTADATDEQMQQVSQTAKELGADLTLPGVSAADAAESITELSKAGLSVQDSLDGVRGSLQLATAAGIDNAAAVELVANAVNAFRLSGADATRVADLLASASKESQGSIEDMGLALRQSAAAAAQAGISVEDTVTLLTQLARAGLTASDAGTSLRVLLIRLINPTEKAQEALNKLGVQLRDTQGNIRPEAFSEIVEALSKLPKAQQDANLAIIAGQDAFRALSITGRDGVTAFERLREAVTEEGVAAQIASSRTQGLAGSTENLKNQLSNVGITFGQVAAGPAKFMADSLAEIASQADKTITAIGDLAAAAKEIPVISVVFDDRQSDSAADKFLARLGDKFKHPLEILAPAAALPRVSVEVDTSDAKKQIRDLRDDLVKAGATPLAFEGAVTGLQDLRDKIKENGGSAEALLGDIDAFIARLQDLSAQPDIELPIKIPEALGGTEVADMGETTAKKFGSTFLPSIDEIFRQAGQQGAASFGKGFDPGVQEFLAQSRAQISSAFLATAKQASAVLDVEFQGGSDAQRRAALEKQLAAQERFVDELIAGHRSQKRIDAAKQDAINTQNQIDAIDAATAAAVEANKNKRAAAARKAEQDRQNEQREFEQGFLAQQARSRQQAQNRITRAEQTPGLQDDIRRQQELLSLTKQQIIAINNSKLSEAAKRTAIDALNTAVISTTGAIKTLQQSQKEQEAAERQRLFDLKAQTLANQGLRAELTDTDKDNERVLLAQIKLFQNEARRLGLATKAGKEAQAAAIQFRIQLKALRDARKDATDEATGGTTLADLFRETQDIFAQGGTVGQLPSGLTTSAANAPIRQLVDQRLDLQLKADPLVSSTKNQTSATDRLTASINALIEKLGGGVEHGGIPSPAAAAALTKAVSGEARFTYQRVASSIVEAGVWG